jgi:hypothetical protein
MALIFLSKPQGPLNFDGEVHVAGSVDQVDLHEAEIIKT